MVALCCIHPEFDFVLRTVDPMIFDGIDVALLRCVCRVPMVRASKMKIKDDESQTGYELARKGEK